MGTWLHLMSLTLPRNIYLQSLLTAFCVKFDHSSGLLRYQIVQLPPVTSFGLVSLLKVISTFEGYLKSKPSL